MIRHRPSTTNPRSSIRAWRDRILTRALRVATAATLAVGAAGCLHKTAPRTYLAPTAAELTNALAARQRLVTSMNARARATSWLDGQRVRATVLMLVERPGQLRFEAEVSLQGTVGLLATDGNQFAFLDVPHNQLRRGPACPANVASLLRIPLAPPDVAAILLGDVRIAEPRPLPSGIPSAPVHVEWDGTRRADVLVLPRLGGEVRILFQPTGARAAAATATTTGAALGAATDSVVAAASPGAWRVVGIIATNPDGSPRWRVDYDELTDIPVGPAGDSRVAMPGITHFAEGATDFDDGVEIKFKERTLGEPADPSAFTIEASAGMAVETVGCSPP